MIILNGYITKELTLKEIDDVSGAGSAGQSMGTAALVSGSAALGSYFAGARLGATFGSAAGPMGAVAGAVVGAAAAYAYYNYFA